MLNSSFTKIYKYNSKINDLNIQIADLSTKLNIYNYTFELYVASRNTIYSTYHYLNIFTELDPDEEENLDLYQFLPPKVRKKAHILKKEMINLQNTIENLNNSKEKLYKKISLLDYNIRLELDIIKKILPKKMNLQLLLTIIRLPTESNTLCYHNSIKNFIKKNIHNYLMINIIKHNAERNNRMFIVNYISNAKYDLFTKKLN
jgi:hypothetical protein